MDFVDWEEKGVLYFESEALFTHYTKLLIPKSKEHVSMKWIQYKNSHGYVQSAVYYCKPQTRATPLRLDIYWFHLFILYLLIHQNWMWLSLTCPDVETGLNSVWTDSRERSGHLYWEHPAINPQIGSSQK